MEKTKTINKYILENVYMHILELAEEGVEEYNDPELDYSAEEKQINADNWRHIQLGAEMMYKKLLAVMN